MVKRNIKLIVENVKINNFYDMTVEEVYIAHDMLARYFGEAKVFEALLLGFRYGYAMGERAEKKKSSLGTGTTKRAKRE